MSKSYRNIYYLWLAIAVLSGAFWSALVWNLLKSPAQAAPVASSVCVNSSCVFSTITDALATSTLNVGDMITVTSTYNGEGETFPWTFTAGKNLTLDCLNNATVINGGDSQASVVLTSTSTIQNCRFSFVNLTVSATSSDNIRIIGNTFSTSTTSTISLSQSYIGPFTIQNNTGLNGIDIQNADNGGAITNNTLRVYRLGGNYGVMIRTSDGVNIASNTIYGYVTTTINALIIVEGSSNVTISTNTLWFPGAASIDIDGGIIVVSDSLNTVISGNDIGADPGAPGDANCIAIRASTATSSIVSTLLVTRNTMFLGPECFGLRVHNYPGTAGTILVTSTYNIYYGYGYNNNSWGMLLTNSNDSASAVRVYTDYDGFYNLQVNYYNSSSTITAVNSQTMDPWFMTADVDTSNDHYLAPLSPYLDIDGDLDIGAHGGSRRNIIYLDDAGVVDYVTIDMADPDGLDIMGTDQVYRDGDTVNMAAGVYTSATIGTSTNFTGNIIITGAGAGTIINGGATSSAITLNGINGSAIQNLVVQNASATLYSYMMPAHGYAYGGNDYGSDGGLGTVYLFAGEASVPITTNTDISPYMGSPPQNWHLSLIGNAEGARIAIYHRVDTYPNQAAAEAIYPELGDGPWTVAYWATTTWTYSSGTGQYSYNTPSGVAANRQEGASLVTTTPAITRISSNGSSFAGFKFVNSSNNTISTVTSTVNGYGVWFAGSSSGNSVDNSVITSSLFYDVFSTSTGNNSIRNTSFTSASSSITGTGEVGVYHKVRGYLTDASGNPIPGAAFTLASANSSVSTTLATLGTGYSGYSGYLQSFTMTSSSISELSGGFNPFILVASPTSTWATTTKTFNLSSVNQTLSMTMYASAPAAPSNFVTTTVNTSSMSFNWTDNSSGNSQEENFIINYISSGGSWPGSTSTLSANATTATISGLTANTQYTFRIKAQNTADSSSFVTSTAIYTLANIPTSLAATPVSYNRIDISWSGDASWYFAENLSNSSSSGWISTSSHSFTGLSCGLIMSFRVQGRNGDSITTPWSDIVSTATGACPTSASSPAPAPSSAPESTPSSTPTSTSTPTGTTTPTQTLAPTSTPTSTATFTTPVTTVPVPATASSTPTSTRTPATRTVTPASSPQSNESVSTTSSIAPVATVEEESVEPSTITSTTASTAVNESSITANTYTTSLTAPSHRLSIFDLTFKFGKSLTRRAAYEFSVLAGSPMTIEIPATAFSKVPSSVEITVFSEPLRYRFVLTAQGSYMVSFPSPSIGNHEGFVEVDYGDGDRDAVEFRFQSLAQGIITSEDGSSIGNAQVSLYSQSGSLIDSSFLDSPNPFTTDSNGAYGWMVENGEYYLKIQAGGYYSRTTPVFSVSNNMVNRFIELIRIPPTIAEVIDPEAPFTQNLGNVSKNLVAKTKAAVKRASQAVEVVADNPTVEKTAEQIVAPTAIGIVVAGAIPLMSWVDILPLLKLLFLQPILLLGKRKRAGWGQVYHSLSKLPVELATVRLFSAKTKNLAQSRVTDNKGKYAFTVEPGEYHIQVEKNNLLFPSALLKNYQSDGRRANLYHGEPIVITDKDAVITANIPLDPISKSKTPSRLYWERIGRSAQYTLSWAGLAVTSVSLYISPRLYIGIILIAHLILLMLFRRLALPARLKSWGIVYDKANKKPLGHVIARLFNFNFNKLVSTEITNRRGRYHFLAGDGKFYLTYEHHDYKPEKTNIIDLTGKEAEAIGVDAGLGK